MDDSSFALNTPPKTWIYRFQALFEVLLLSGLLSSFLATLLISVYHRRNVAFAMMEAKTICAFLLLEAGFTFFLLAVILRAHGETVGSLGLKWSRWKTNLLLGLALVPFLFIVNSIVTFVFRFYLPKYYIEQNPLIELIHTPQQLALFIFSALIAGGIKEEVQRAFILNRFRRYLGGAALGLVLWSLAFVFAGGAGNLHSRSLRFCFWHRLSPKWKPDRAHRRPWRLRFCGVARILVSVHAIEVSGLQG
jgi:hypothetical protein